MKGIKEHIVVHILIPVRGPVQLIKIVLMLLDPSVLIGT